MYGLASKFFEGLPIIGIVFSISNRVAAAMLAHDLEKRQHKFADGELRPQPAKAGLSSSVSSAAEGLTKRPMAPTSVTAPAPNDPPPAYSEHDVADAIGSY